MPHRYLLRFSGEITTKAPKTRKQFIKQIKGHIKSALKIYRKELQKDFSFSVNTFFDRIEVTSEEPVAEVLQNIFGISKIGTGKLVTYFSYEELLEKSFEFFQDKVTNRQFAVRTRSKNKKISAQKFNRDLGEKLFPYGNGVNLTNPEFTAYLLILSENEAWLIDNFLEGVGGFPLGNEGEAYMLFSGGIDSPAASFLMLRKGIKLQFLYYDLGSQIQLEHALKQAQFLTRKYALNYRPKFFVFDFQPVIAKLLELKPAYQNLALKYTFYKVAEIFSQEKPNPIVTGEALAQVSTQTFSNLTTLSRITERTVFRPLLAWTKEEITSLAKKIGTYPLAFTGKELCALSKKNVKTKSDVASLLDIVREIPEELLQKTAENPRKIELSPVKKSEELLREARPEEEQFSEFVPIFIDLETPGNLSFAFNDAWNKVLQLDKNKNYYLVCETGNKSAILANLMNEAGFKARPLSYEQFRELQNPTK